MHWRDYLRSKTRQASFLWRIVLGILAAGLVLGVLAQWLFFEEAVVDGARRTSAGSAWPALEQLAARGEWAAVWWQVAGAIYTGYDSCGPVVLATLAGGCWLAFLLQCLGLRGVSDPRLWCALFGVALGVLSIWPTGFFILWQEFVWGLSKSPEPVAGLRYWVLGVGLREEFAKLCCFLPLLPILCYLRSELTALLVAACVGLGFAVEENVGYFLGDKSATVGRLLTANPAHLALTGLIGLQVYRAVRDPRQWAGPAVATFGLLVFAHGIYDAAICLPLLADYSLVGVIVFALVIYQFFRELRTLRTFGGDMVSLSATFLCGVSLVTAATFVYLCGTQGFSLALDMLLEGILGLGVMVYLFLREMPESLVRV